MPRDFYPEELTRLSQRVLDDVLLLVPEAILIGGWATYFRVGGGRSHDIDLIVEPHQLDVLRRDVGDLTRSTHLGTKYRGSLDGIHLDLHVPFQSRLGRRLQLPVEALVAHAVDHAGHRLLAAPAHLVTKIAALLDRPETLPGDKDREEIWRLLNQEPIDPAAVAGVLSAAQSPAESIPGLVEEAFGYLGDIDGLSRQDRNAIRGMRRHFTEAAARLSLP